MKSFDLWDSENELVKSIYQKDNYQVWNREGQEKKCLILFSGNGLFYPNTEEVFSDVIVKKDRYEYQNLAKSSYLNCFKRIIFVRDIYKQWYITGINEKCPDVETTAELLKKETKGYRVTTAGNSAGGYAAVLFGILLNAENIFSFSGQYDITERKSAPFIEQYRRDISKSRFYDLRAFLQIGNIKSKIYYFWPNQNINDKHEYELIKNIPEIKTFEFVSKKHEKTVLPFQIPYILSMEDKDFEDLYQKYYGKRIYAWEFLFSSMGLYKGAVEVFHYLCVKIKSRKGRKH